jgi:outer membrane protein assembly factor BamB
MTTPPRPSSTTSRRLAALATAIALLAPAGPAPAELASSPWPMFGADSRHTGRGTTNGPQGPTVHAEWTYKAPANYKDAPPTIGPDGTIYLAAGLLPLCAVNPNGTQKWCTSGLGGGAGGAAPTVGVDPQSPGTGPVIYMGGRDNKTWAVKDKGQDNYTVLWRYKILADGDVHSSALIDPQTDAIYAACGCVTAGQLIALDATPSDMTDGPGEAIFPAALIKPAIHYASPAQEDRSAPFRHRRVYIPGTDGKLYAFTPDDANSQWVLRWVSPQIKKAGNKRSSPVIGDDGTIYMGTYLGLTAITDHGASATHKWNPAVVINERIDAAPALSQDGSTVYVGTSTKPYRLYAINASTGAVKWYYPGDNPADKLAGLIDTPAVVDKKNSGEKELIYVAAGKKVYAIQDDVTHGTLKWSYPAGGVVLGVSLGDDALYVTANDHKLYKLVDD